MKRCIYAARVLIIALCLYGCGATVNSSDLEKEEIIFEKDTIVAKTETDDTDVIEKDTLEIEEIVDEEVATDEGKNILEKNAFDGKVSSEDFRVIIDGVEVICGSDMNNLISLLGEPDSYQSARSCMDDGEEKVYVYGGYTLITYPNAKKDIICQIEFGEGAVTDADIGLGSTRADVEKAYGTQYEIMGDNIIYEISIEQAITVQYSGDKVIWLDMYYR